MLRFTILALGAAGSHACSHFTMENDYIITGRTEDLPGSDLKFKLITKPRGSKGLRASKYGYVAFIDSNVRSGLNDAGLQCDKQTIQASHPGVSLYLDNIDAAKICQWGLEGYGSIAELKVGLLGVNFLKSTDPKFNEGHWAFRDTAGKGVVIEFSNHAMHVYDDNNDGGKTGYGIMTNDPPFPVHVQMLAELQKQEHAKPLLPDFLNVRMQGSFVPTARDNRIFLMKSNFPKPKDAQEALMQAIHTLNSVSVPMDNAKGFFGGSVTQWAAVYDQKNRVVYWRSHNNQNMQRLRLAEADLGEGAKEKSLDVFSPRLPWFSDASSILQQDVDTVMV